MNYESNVKSLSLFLRFLGSRENSRTCELIFDCGERFPEYSVVTIASQKFSSTHFCTSYISFILQIFYANHEFKFSMQTMSKKPLGKVKANYALQILQRKHDVISEELQKTYGQILEQDKLYRDLQYRHASMMNANETYVRMLGIERNFGNAKRDDCLEKDKEIKQLDVHLEQTKKQLEKAYFMVTEYAIRTYLIIDLANIVMDYLYGFHDVKIFWVEC